MKKIILIFSILFILILTLSAVQATETNENINYTAQHAVSEKTFESIQDTIDNSSQSDTILLEGSYIGSGKAININKSITVKGIDNARLNANSKSQILNIKADNVVLENIAFVNGNNYDGGGAIYIGGNNIKIINCKFTSNYVKLYGGGILSKGDNISIINCQFTKNTAESSGGAMELDGDNNYVDNCVFTENTGGHVGGAISLVGDNGIVKNSKFINSLNQRYPSQFGGAIVWMGSNGWLKVQYSIKMLLKNQELQYIGEVLMVP